MTVRAEHSDDGRQADSAEVSPPPGLRSAERITFFTDAVVAIALTLLIIPLLESVIDSEGQGHTGHQWLVEHGGLLPGFALSFVLIATFWMGHHSLYEHVRALTPAMTWLNVLWMFTIVWLPVATAITGLRTDRTSVSIYIGTLVVTSVTALAVNLIVERRPVTWVPGNPPTGRSIGVAAALSILYAVALVVALVIATVAPEGQRGNAYYALFVLALTSPLARVLRRVLSTRPAATRP
ncbi:MAG: TMEM175 family protein [Intrasporangium sp.]|uniref:TMEM175 family protein n=1 Tax=Intrasporangium sp. TaxID=1925024 RepID=UPI002649DA3E|nr:TMEM175 family protein [Intrasporangium sp.]MDN5794556.1 TMEM175 family protein [Intrasporangium sp.]